MSLLDDWDNEKVTYTKRVGVGKFGISADFSAAQSIESAKKGMCELYNYLILRARNEPTTEFVWVTTSNYWRLKLSDRMEFPSNVRFLNFKEVSSVPMEDKILTLLGKNGIDELYMFAGPTSQVAGGVVPGILSRKGTPMQSLQMFHRYVSGPLKFINNTTMPWYTIITDNRYHFNMLDLVRLPNKVYGLGTKKYNYNFKHVTDPSKPTELSIDNIEVEMSDIHLICIMDKPKIDYSKQEKSVNLIAVANQIKPTDDDRYKLIKKYVLDQNIDCKIVGKWENEEYIKSFGDLLINKDGLTREALFEYSNKARYSLIFSYDTIRVSSELNKHLKDERIGWVVPKIYEMLYSGIVPIFIEMDRFDDELPEQLFVNSPEDLRKTLEWLSNNPLDLSHFITDEKLSGKYFYRTGEFKL